MMIAIINEVNNYLAFCRASISLEFFSILLEIFSKLNTFCSSFETNGYTKKLHLNNTSFYLM